MKHGPAGHLGHLAVRRGRSRPRRSLARRDRVEGLSLALDQLLPPRRRPAGGLNHGPLPPQAARPEPADRLPHGLHRVRPGPAGPRRPRRRPTPDRWPPPSSSTRFGAQFGLDQPFLQQYWIFVQQLFTRRPRHVVLLPGPGHSRSSSTGCRTRITLAIAAILLTAVVAIPLGVWMARRADTGANSAPTSLTIAGQSMPDFWTGIMLLTLFAVLIPMLPGLRLRHLARRWSCRPSPSRSCRSP